MAGKTCGRCDHENFGTSIPRKGLEHSRNALSSYGSVTYLHCSLRVLMQPEDFGLAFCQCD